MSAPINELASIQPEYGTERLFRNRFLESLTHVHPIVPALVWLPILFFFYWNSIRYLPLLQVAAIVLAALCTWTLCEYLIHRFLFHWRSDKPAVRALAYLFHGIHHDFPNDRTRLLMPPIASLPIGFVLYAIFRETLGPVWADPFFAGFVLGYLIYDYTHYLIHFTHPKTAFGKALKGRHVKHHFVSDHIYYGVSSPIWDYLFGTTVDLQGLDYVRVNTPEPHFQRTRQIVARYPQVRKLFGPTPSTAFFIISLVTIQLAVAYLLRAQMWWVNLLVAYTLGAVANHALFVMVHECSHNLVFKSGTANRLISILANIPIVFPSAISFRNYHIAHHRYQGSIERDADLAVPLEATLIGNSVFGKTFWMLFFFIFQTVRVSAVKKVPFLDRWVILNWVFEISALSTLTYLLGWPALLYLFLSSMFSVGLHPLGARWIQEHFLTNGLQETHSYYGPLNLVAFNVGYHNEHHDLMNVAWSRLPQVKAMAPEFYEPLHDHRSWTLLFLRFLFDPNLSLYSRVVRD